MKKLILVVGFFVFSFLGFSQASASSTLIYPVIENSDVIIIPNTLPVTRMVIWRSNGLWETGYRLDDNNFAPYDLTGNVTNNISYKALVYSGDNCTDSYSTCLALITNNYHFEFSYNSGEIGLTNNPPSCDGTIDIFGVCSGGGLFAGGEGMFFGTNENTKQSTALDLTARAGTAIQSTVGNLTPVVAVVGGIILAIIAIRFVIETLYATDNKKKGNRKI